MDIAIIGAGLAGLSCAHELEKYGISPVIYERNSFIGEPHLHVSAILEIIHRPIKDSVKYFKKDFGIDIQPLNTLNRVIHNSPNKVTEIKGNLGYFFSRSKEPNDVKNQMYSKLRNTRVLFNEYGDYQLLSEKYDYLIIANGNIDFTNELGCWKQWLNTYVRGAIVLGDFDPNTLIVWLNKDYCKNGYAYLTPFDNKRASMIIIVTDVDEREVDRYWELFLYTENIKYTIIEEFKLHHSSGYVYPHRIGNMFLAGDAGGVIDPFPGFGQMSSITMGVMAARAIVEGKDYKELTKSIFKRNMQLHEFKRLFDITGNAGFDVLMASIGLPGIRHVLYYTPLNVIKLGSYVLKLIPKKIED